MTDLQIYSILLAIMFLGFGFLIGFVYCYKSLFIKKGKNGTEKDLFRIVKYPKGYIIEYKVKTLFSTKWKHFMGYSGLPDNPYYYINFELALEDLQYEVKKMVSKNNTDI